MECASSGQSFRVSRRMTFYMRINVARRRSGSAKGYDGRYSITSKEAGSPSTSASGSTIPCQALRSPPRGYVVSSRAELLKMTHRQNGGSYGSVGNQSVNLSEQGRDSFCRGVPEIMPSRSPTNRLSGLTISFDNPHLKTTHRVPTPCSGKRKPHFQEPLGSSRPSSTVPPGKRFAPPACCSYSSMRKNHF